MQPNYIRKVTPRKTMTEKNFAAIARAVIITESRIISVLKSGVPKSPSLLRHYCFQCCIELQAERLEEFETLMGYTLEEGDVPSLFQPRSRRYDAEPALDYDGIRKFLEEAVALYETSAPAAAQHCDWLYRRLADQPKNVTYYELENIIKLKMDGHWKDPHQAANFIYHLRNDLKMGHSVTLPFDF